MNTFYQTSQDLSRGDLNIHVSQNGIDVDGLNISYTIFDTSGNSISGRNLSSINYKAGLYYAPYRASRPGSFQINWYLDGSNLYSTWFYVYQNGSFSIVNGEVSNPSVIPNPSTDTFLVGYVLEPSDLQVQFRNEFDQLIDPASVNVRILNPHGMEVSKLAPAVRISQGIYYTNWLVYGLSGTYTVVYVYVDPLSNILSEISKRFTVICPTAPVAVRYNPCSKQPGCTCGC